MRIYRFSIVTLKLEGAEQERGETTTIFQTEEERRVCVRGQNVPSP